MLSLMNNSQLFTGLVTSFAGPFVLGITTMDNITQEEKNVVDELRKRTINDMTSKLLEDDSVFYRFAKARDFDLVEAEAMLRKHHDLDPDWTDNNQWSFEHWCELAVTSFRSHCRTIRYLLVQTNGGGDEI
ncbi:hypothetical protein AVEN_224224-1 [Araneus ventricosus]|uniref:CRAL/TRIO N-terminal domain-containing protein n=1 Tax=Araneus ventricosus TaxID=182803 RepID=A0A4Y2MPS8_ARAVE|nr:hypothetical protein AVEN_224224-1 [Araneus ventricosus]